MNKELLNDINETIKPLGLKAELKNNGHQIYIKCRKGAVNYYPSTDLWVDDRNISKTNYNKMIKYLRNNYERLQPINKQEKKTALYFVKCAIKKLFKW